MIASLNASCILYAKSSKVNPRCVNFGNRARDCSHVVNFFRPRGRGEVQSFYSRYSASSCSSFPVDDGLEFRALKSSRFERSVSRSKLDALSSWKRGARMSSSSHESGNRVRFCACVKNGRWRPRFAARCGKTGSVEGGVNSSVAVLDFYLIQELLPPLVLGTAAFTLVGVSIGVGPEVIALVEKLGFSFRHSLLYVQIIFLRLPSYICLALPMASLLASMLAFGRLGVDCEIIALRAAGIGSLRMLRPTFILFMGITALHLLLAEGLTPRANHIAMEAANTAIASVSTIRDFGMTKKTRTSSAAYSRPVIYPEYRKHRLAHLLYAQGFNGVNSLLTVTFVQMEAVQDQVVAPRISQSKVNAALSVRRVVLAEKATWDDVLGLWIFSNGCEYVLGKPPQSRGFSTKGNLQKNGSSLQCVRRFSSQFISELSRAPLDFAKLGVNKSFEDMTVFEASSLLGLMKASRNVKESRKLQVKIQQRMSLPFASIVFSSVGCLFSLHLSHEQKHVGMALTLVIVFCYYSVSVFGSLIGQLGYVSPILGAWLPNLAGTLLALALSFSTP